MEISVARRANILRLFSEFVASEQAQNPGCSLSGMDRAFSLKIQVHNTYFSGMKSGARPIGDKLARQIEANTGKQKGWLDAPAESAPAKSKTLQRLIDRVESAYLASDARGRRRLEAIISDFAKGDFS